MPFVYILRCGDGSFYTGATKDLARRLAAHAAGKAARYTRGRLPVSLAWSAEAATWETALAEERRIKGFTRARKLALIAAAADVPEVSGPQTQASERRPRQGRARAPKADAADV